MKSSKKKIFYWILAGVLLTTTIAIASYFIYQKINNHNGEGFENNDDQNLIETGTIKNGSDSTLKNIEDNQKNKIITVLFFSNSESNDLNQLSNNCIGADFYLIKNVENSQKIISKYDIKNFPTIIIIGFNDEIYRSNNIDVDQLTKVIKDNDLKNKKIDWITGDTSLIANPNIDADPTIINQWETIKLFGQNSNEQYSGWKNPSNPTIETTIIDVGQGDAILIKTSPNNDFNDYNNTFNILIDSGDFQSRKASGSNLINTPNFKHKLEPFLDKQSLIDDKIDLYIFSHSDADHIGGASDVISKYCKPDESIVLSFGNNEKTTSTWRNTLDSIGKNNLFYIDPFLNETLKTPMFKEVMELYYEMDFGLSTKTNDIRLFDIEPNTDIVAWSDSAFFNYICPSYDYKTTGNGLNETNESSINNYLKWNDYSFLFSGDSEQKTHDDLIEIMSNNDKYKNDDETIYVDFYKSAHHGSITHGSNNVNFLKTILDSESKILISQNDNRLYSGTPTFTESSMENIVNTNINFDTPPIYSTQDVGDIVIRIDSDSNGWKNYNLINTYDRHYQILNSYWSIDNITMNNSSNQSNEKYSKYFYVRK